VLTRTLQGMPQMRVSIIILFSVFLWSGVLLDHENSLHTLNGFVESLLIYFVGTYLMCCLRNDCVDTDSVATESDRDRLGLCLTIERQFNGLCKGQNLSGFVLRNRQGHDRFG